MNFKPFLSRCKEIFDLVAATDPKLKKLISDGSSLADRLHKLAEARLDQGTCTVDEAAPTLKRMVEDK